MCYTLFEIRKNTKGYEENDPSPKSMIMWVVKLYLTCVWTMGKLTKNFLHIYSLQMNLLCKLYLHPIIWWDEYSSQFIDYILFPVTCSLEITAFLGRTTKRIDILVKIYKVKFYRIYLKRKNKRNQIGYSVIRNMQLSIELILEYYYAWLQRSGLVLK